MHEQTEQTYYDVMMTSLTPVTFTPGLIINPAKFYAQ